MAQTRFTLHHSRASVPRIESARRARRVLAALCTVVLAFAFGGCAYRVSIQQGNLVDAEDLNQVREGMTRSQVQFLLGTPMISDPFHADRWDYTYYIRLGRDPEVTSHWVTIYFEDDQVARIEEHIPPPGSEALEEEVAAR